MATEAKTFCRAVPHMRRAIVIAIIVGVPALCAWAYWYRTGSRVYVPSGPAVSATVFVVDQPLGTITNSAGLQAVASMLRSGRPVPLSHSCGAAGRIETRFADGQTLTVAFGPGHESSRYEFGTDGHVFHVSRTQFLDSLSTGGIDVQKIPR